MICSTFEHIELLEQGLHNEPQRLQRELQEAIDRVEADHPEAQVIVLGYGLCSRGTEGLYTRRCRLVAARAHDCITLLLGDKQRYAQYVKDNPGTYWYSPGWNRHGKPPGKERYERIYKQYQPNQDFAASYAQADLVHHYGEEREFSVVVELAALLAVVVASLGMFGLSAFVAERRARETAIRRVLGASIVHLAGRLFWELTLPVVIASVVSLPISYKVGRSLLEPFAYRIVLGPSIYLSGALIALLLANVSAIYWVVRVTRANPVEVLRHE